MFGIAKQIWRGGRAMGRGMGDEIKYVWGYKQRVPQRREFEKFPKSKSIQPIYCS